MIHYLTGNIFDSEATALVNTVNLVGVMGKGIALQFKNQFPLNFKRYQDACKNQEIGIGQLFVTKESSILGEKIIINFPTKIHWRTSSEYSYIEEGLADLKRVIKEYQITSIALPPLGAGNGGLNWEKVKQLINKELSNLDITIYVYEPNSYIKEHLKSERAKLTDARALLLYVLYDLVRHGEYVSEFSSEKVCYFLQKFGAQDLFRLTYKPKYYGPYSGKVRYVLKYLNGSYIMGYSDMDKKPFESISIIPDYQNEIEEYISQNSRLSEIAQKTTNFLNGFYSDFGLELLSSVDFILTGNPTESVEQVYSQLCHWNQRKNNLFADIRYVKIAYNHLKEQIYNRSVNKKGINN